MKYRDAQLDPVSRLAESLRKLPGIGAKSAQRIAMSILRAPKEYAEELTALIREVATQTKFCSRCRNISSSDPCAICADPKREPSLLCVVEEPADMVSIERTNAYRGLYYILHGALSPMNAVGPEDIRTGELIERITKGNITEIILATNLDAEGEATASYLAKRMKSLKVRVTRIARGVPVGSDLQYVDEATLGESLSGRREMD